MMDKKEMIILGAAAAAFFYLTKGKEENKVPIPNFCTNNLPPTLNKPRTANFKLSEFNSPDIKNVPRWAWGNIQALMEQLEIVRAEFNKRLGGGVICVINSGFRTVQYNNELIQRGYQASATSKHLCGQAADFKLRKSGKFVDAADIQEFINKEMAAGRMIKGGLGRSSSYTHYDIRGTIKSWTYNK